MHKQLRPCHLLKRNFPENWSKEKERFLEVPDSACEKRSVYPAKYPFFNRLTLVAGAATLLRKILRVRVGGLVVATPVRDHQQIIGELARR
jgi:hypothetical protein